MRLFSRNKNKNEPMKDNKFSPERKHKIRSGFVDNTLERLKDFYELLRIDPDDHGYTPLTTIEINEGTDLGYEYISTLVLEKLVSRVASTDGKTRFKYKWDTIYPTKHMALNLIKVTYNRLNRPADFGEEERKLFNEDKMKELPNKPGLAAEITHAMKKKVQLLDYNMDKSVMTVSINLELFDVKEQDVINAIMTLLIENPKK